MARIELSFDAWKDGRVSPATVEMPVAVLDVKDSEQIAATLRGHTDPVSSVAFAPDGKTLATCTHQGKVKLWDVESAKERRTLDQSGSTLGLAFLPDGRTLATSWFEPFGKDGKALTSPYRAKEVKGFRGGVKLWDLTTGKERGVLQRQSPRGVTSIALSPDGKMLAAEEAWRENDGKDIKGGVALWDVAAGKVVRDFNEDAFALAFAPDGKTLAINPRKGEGVLLWDVAGGRQRGKLGGDKINIRALAFSPDGKLLAGCDFQGTVHLWDASSGEEKAVLQHSDSQTASCLAFAPDGKTLAVGVGPRNSQDIEPGEVVLWDTATSKKRLTLHGHIGNVLSLSFSADGALLASGGLDKTIKLWNIASRAASKR
jgi:WD40 repeat protein